MVSSSSKVETLGVMAALNPPAARTKDPAKPFSEQLITALGHSRKPGEQAVDRPGAAASQSSGARQEIGGQSGAVRAINSPFTNPCSGNNSPGPADSPPSPPMTEGDAYWAAQPAAVQALRYMPQGAEKNALALSLASQGYTIDTEIMVMGWDPQMTMVARAAYGYTWVPSYGQPAINVQPGVSDPYMPSSYNPGVPPPGSIIVSTAFAQGTIQNPLVHTSQSAT